MLGDRVVVQAGAVLGSTGFGYARDAETGSMCCFRSRAGCMIEDDVEIGANTTIDRGALGETRIGRGTKIDNLVHVGHNCVIGKNVVIAAQTGISGSSVVEDGAILGGQVGIGEHATVGAGVILGGGAGVLSGKKMRGQGEVFWGRPARPLKEYLRDLARLKQAVIRGAVVVFGVVEMVGSMAIVVVGGHTKNIGKTSVVAGLIAALPEMRWTAFKITQFGHGMCSANGEPCDCETAEHTIAVSEERRGRSRTDSGRYLAAGAVRSFWVRTRQGRSGGGDASDSQGDRAGRECGDRVEQHSAVSAAGFYLSVLDPEAADFKDSARYFLDRADAVLVPEGELGSRNGEGFH